MKYTVIVATYNSVALLERTILSVLSQSYPARELIVQDGASTDGTLDILKKYDKHINWQSEPDAGLYDAWNKALDRASGDWGIFLGSDDFLINNDVLVKCHRHIKRLPKEILFAYGALAMGRNAVADEVDNRPLWEVYKRFCGTMGLPFSGTFVRLALAQKYKFDPSFKVAGDFDFAARFLTHCNVARLPLIVSYVERGGISNNRKHDCVRLDERNRVLVERVMPKAHEFVQGCLESSWEAEPELEPL